MKTSRVVPPFFPPAYFSYFLCYVGVLWFVYMYVHARAHLFTVRARVLANVYVCVSVNFPSDTRLDTQRNV